MMAATKIPWCDKTWNPIVGCSKVSSGCMHCYAECMARRQVAMGNENYLGIIDKNGAWTGQLNFIKAAIDAPLHWRKPSRIFICSMSDIFHPNSKKEWIVRVFGIMDACLRRGIDHIFILLTKRPESAVIFFKSHPYSPGEKIWKNIWLGVTVECRQQIGRIHTLTNIPRITIGKIFVSCEPMLNLIDLRKVIKKLDWVICGSESGPGARPMDPDWARSLRDQCIGAGVPFFLKQMTGIRTAQRELPKLDGRTWGEFPNGRNKKQNDEKY